MSEQDLEVEVENIFRKSRLIATHSPRRRLREILNRGFHELSLKDLLNLLGHMLIVMLTLVSTLAKSLFKPRSAQRTKDV